MDLVQQGSDEEGKLHSHKRYRACFVYSFCCGSTIAEMIVINPGFLDLNSFALLPVVFGMASLGVATFVCGLWLA